MIDESKNIKHKKFVQFAPSQENQYYPGVFGWGIETHGYRMVMYGPAEADHPAVKAVVMRKEKFSNETEEGIEKPKRTGFRRGSFTAKEKYERCLKAGEHGPCHVHVFDIKSGRETRFELIEHYSADDHYAQPLHLSETRDNRDNGLTDGQIKAVQPILNSMVPDFIQQWREMYQTSPLSGYVSRVVKIGKDDLIETAQADGSTKIYSPKSGTTAVIPMSSELEPISRRILRPRADGHDR